MLINKGFAGSPMTDMTEMTAFSHPHTCAHARIYILFTCHFCHKEKKEEEKDRKIKGFRHDSFFAISVIYLSQACHKKGEQT